MGLGSGGLKATKAHEVFPSRAAMLHNGAIHSEFYTLTKLRSKTALRALRYCPVMQERRKKPYTICPTFTASHSLASLPIAHGFFFHSLF